MMDTHTLTQAIALAMGEGWTAEARAHNDVLVSPDMRLYCRLGSYGSNRHLHIMLDTQGLSQYRGYGYDIPDIGVNPDRSPESIARDIQRRLLPDARRVYAELKVAGQRDAEYNDKRYATLAKVSTAIGIMPRKPLSSHDYQAYGSIGSVNVEAHCDSETVRLDLRSLPVALAVNILCMIRREVGGG